MTYAQQFLELDDLEDEFLIWEEFKAFSGLTALGFKGHVTLSWRIDTREEITKQVHEDLQILSHNLGKVEISKSTHEKIRFR